jgi:carbonic anhydrase/acetyltransferase-like protein (isoleucine patch superfamily)
MMEWNPSGDYPRVDETAYVHETAVIIGRVKIGRKVFVGPHAVIRADEPGSSVVIGDQCNVQDRVIIHALKDSAVEVEDTVSLSHGCIIHGPCKIGKGCFIGFGSVVFNSCLAGGVFVRFLAVISGVDIPKNRFVNDGAVIDTKQKARALKLKSAESEIFAQGVIQSNMDLVKGYKREGKQQTTKKT